MKDISFKINENGCHIVTSHLWKDPAGYVRTNRKINGKRINLMHRYIYLTKVGDIPAGLCVCHKCDVKDCINPTHFFLGTKAENNNDRHKKGRTSRVSRCYGEKNGSRKLSNDDILNIRKQKYSITQRELAKKYGVTKHHISKIQRDERWSHIKEGY
jgi:hypothetical protein